MKNGSKKPWSGDATLRLSRWSDDCRTLGPGTRAVLWVQGCCFRCPGCVAPEMLAPIGGTLFSVEELAERLLALDDIEGVTFSGGEPFLQAAALARLIDLTRHTRDLSFMSYTGFTLSELQTASDPARLNLLARLDLLVDGRYRRDQHANLLWRGSRNQQVHFLSDRHADLRNTVDQLTVAIDLSIETDGSFSWAGIPPQGFRATVERGMKDCGVSFRSSGGIA